MIGDVWTVLRKEFREIQHLTGARRGGWIGIAVLLAMFGILLPWQAGPQFLSGGYSVAFATMLALSAVNATIADSFAGERERHTLETLLASRLPDDAILIGKLGASIAYGWGLALAILAIGLVTANVAHSGTGFVFYSPGVAVAGVAASLLVAGFAGGLGVLVSLRAATVKQAYQTVAIVFTVLFFLPLLAFFMAPPEAFEWLRARFTRADVQRFLVVAGLAAAAVDIALIAAARVRFRRTRLLLD